MSGTNVTIGPDTIESRDDLPKGDRGTWEYWMGQEDIADKEEGNWPRGARVIIERYRDERDSAARNVHKFNILWSNVQTLLPTYYARTPKPEVSRRYLDQVRRTIRFLGSGPASDQSENENKIISLLESVDRDNSR